MQKYETDHYENVRKMGPECMVLLKSDGSFPVDAGEKIALYGNGARHTKMGGTGGGIVEVRTFTTIEQGLLNAGIKITSGPWLDAYDDIQEAAREAHRAKVKANIETKGLTALNSINVAMPEPDYELPLNAPGKTAIYVVTRACGEGADRRAQAGDLFLTATEIRDILKANETYEKFLLVLNVSGVVDLSPVAHKVKNILLLSQPGIAVGDAFADVLCGRAYPSGKLASTWAAWDSYASMGDFGQRDETRYVEGIYVGYRYFDSIGKEPLFSFGHGLGYTSFSLEAGIPELHKESKLQTRSMVSVPVTVKNTGKYPGKEVVQLYVTPPQGKLDQPYQVLAAFEKTQELAPGQEQTLSVSFDMESLASFDTEQSCRILEAGSYLLRVGNGSRNTRLAGVIKLDQTAVVEKVTHVGGTPDFTDWAPDFTDRTPDFTDWKSDHERLVAASGEELPLLRLAASDVTPYCHHQPAPDGDAQDFVKALSNEALAYFCTGGFPEAGAVKRSARTVPGAVGMTTWRWEAEGIPSLNMSDGPAGIHISGQYGVDAQGPYILDSEQTKEVKKMLPEHALAILLKQFPDADNEHRHGQVYEQYCTAIPIETALAQSWNPKLCEACGDIAAEEMERFGIQVWLAPALNIHRNPLCGRNFEYFSEDPLLCGKMAAAVVRGTQRHPHCGSTLKHFVCNEQETNRLFNNSMVSERALRDIYMRPFEIAIKEAKPMAVMSSYNLLNGEHTSQRRDLMETVLREEWGFEGIVMSDWVGGQENSDGKKYPVACSNGAIAAGNDLMMPGCREHYDNILSAVDNSDSNYPLTREDLEKCAARMITYARKFV